MKVVLARSPSPALARHVKVLWAMVPPPVGSTIIRLPMNRSHLAWPLPTGRCLVQTRIPGQAHVDVGGPLVSAYEAASRAITCLPPAPQVLVGAEFTPGGLQAFFDEPMGSLPDSLFRLAELWGDHRVASDTAQLIDAASRSMSEVLGALDLLLMQRLRHDAHELLPAQRALSMLLVQGEEVAVTEAAKRSGMGERQFRDVVRRGTGLTPKLHARLLRFGKALSGLHHDKTPTETALAAECGYFDQAHFIHEFKSLSGLRPTDYRRDHVQSEHSACVLSRVDASWQQWTRRQDGHVDLMHALIT